MNSVILFCICLAASGIGAIVGAGGGVIIKPLLDMFGILPLSTIGFCSGCTVLGMSVSSLIRNRKDGIKLRIEISTPLAIGAVIGGLLGQYVFNTLLEYFSKPKILGIIQAFLLAVMMIGVYIYVEKKTNIKSLNIQNKVLSAFIGFLLGLSSSFLGIGGGPANVAVLFYFFSMNAKEAVKNSLYVIIFSQLSSLGLSMYRGTIPEAYVGADE